MAGQPTALGAEVPIRRVRQDGTVDLLGHFRPAQRELDLVAPGYPLAGVGKHPIEGDLPWVFDEAAPDGFLAKSFASWFPELGLPRDRALWSPRNVLDAICERGHDLSGNLVIGEASWELYQRTFQGEGLIRGLDRAEAPLHYARFADQALQVPSRSSVGGARPKFVLRLAGGAGLIVKFTPPLSTQTGRRWADLLRMEAHAANVLRDAGIRTVGGRYLEHEGRGYLEVERFDRLPGGGRVGHVTLFNLGVALYGEAENATKVVAALARDGMTAADHARFQRVHAFSRAINNDDTHLGNYGLVIDDDGACMLAPAYDVVPMAFAPRHDELPDRLVRHAAPCDSATAALVERLVEVAEKDEGLSRDFFEAWRASVA